MTTLPLLTCLTTLTAMTTLTRLPIVTTRSAASTTRRLGLDGWPAMTGNRS